MKTILLAAALVMTPGAATALSQSTHDHAGHAAHAAPVDHEATLRSIIIWAAGDETAFGYDRFTPELAEAIRNQGDAVTHLLQGFGSVQTVTHQGEVNGAQHFRVEFENAATNWFISTDEAGLVNGLLFQPAQ